MRIRYVAFGAGPLLKTQDLLRERHITAVATSRIRLSDWLHRRLTNEGSLGHLEATGLRVPKHHFIGGVTGAARLHRKLDDEARTGSAIEKHS